MSPISSQSLNGANSWWWPVFRCLSCIILDLLKRLCTRPQQKYSYQAHVWQSKLLMAFWLPPSNCLMTFLICCNDPRGPKQCNIHQKLYYPQHWEHIISCTISHYIDLWVFSSFGCFSSLKHLWISIQQKCINHAHLLTKYDIWMM